MKMLDPTSVVREGGVRHGTKPLETFLRLFKTSGTKVVQGTKTHARTENGLYQPNKQKLGSVSVEATAGGSNL